MPIPAEVLDNLKTAIERQSGHSVLPVRAERWEEMVVNAFKKSGFHPGWDPGSHQPGMDITLPMLGMAVSCKSAQVSGTKIKKLKFSSFRTTQFKTLEEKIDYFDGVGKNFSHYLIIAREECDRFRGYTVWLIDSSHIKASEFKWQLMKSGWKTKERYGFTMRISKSMSDQFWISVDLRYLQNHAKHKPHEVCVLFEKRFNKRQLGKTHHIIETNRDLAIEAEEYSEKDKRWTTLVSSKEKIT